MPPRSILRNGGQSSGSQPVNPRHLETALYHARLIESRKEIEAQILKSIIELYEFPTSSTADPKNPSPEDAQAFADSLIPFQPSDYDALIEERNCIDKCGYTLCPKKRKKAPSTAKLQFIDTEHGVEIVEKKLLEMWCSDDCARRALFVKVQLNEQPAWERRGGIGKIELMADNVNEHHKALPLRLKDNGVANAENTQGEDDVDEQAWADREQALKELAMERGENMDQLSKANKDVIAAEVVERTDNNAPKAPSRPAGHSDQSHLAIEGHVPKANKKNEDRAEEDEDHNPNEGDTDSDSNLESEYPDYQGTGEDEEEDDEEEDGIWNDLPGTRLVT